MGSKQETEGNLPCGEGLGKGNNIYCKKAQSPSQTVLPYLLHGTKALNFHWKHSKPCHPQGTGEDPLQLGKGHGKNSTSGEMLGKDLSPEH